MSSIMEDAQIDLFGSEMPSFEQIRKLASLVNASNLNMAAFSEELEANGSRSKDSGKGIGLYILRQYAKAIKSLDKADDSKEKYVYLGLAHSKEKNFDEALSNFEKAGKKSADSLMISLLKGETLRNAGRFEEASEVLKSCSNFEKVSADYHFQLGRLNDAEGDYEAAIENYKIAVELDGGHQEALFHLAYACDLRGDDEAAIDYYKQMKNNSPVYANAMLNLAVLYEDICDYDRAEICVDMVLECHPNHAKALLFAKDVQSSRVMIYDEEKEKMQTQHNQILEIPISDFELSVRSRNCLKKMNIFKIGDLLRISEAELLSYKNFGETSLAEIQTILDQKGLILGMSLEDQGKTIAEEAVADGVDYELLNTSVDEFGLSVRARRCLQRLQIRTIADMISKTEAELLGCKNFGVTSLDEIKEKLASSGLSLRTLQ